ncbi:hypothetical protein PCE1_001703 [Barthelona sp. PCE]
MSLRSALKKSSNNLPPTTVSGIPKSSLKVNSVNPSPSSNINLIPSSLPAERSSLFGTDGLSYSHKVLNRIKCAQFSGSVEEIESLIVTNLKYNLGRTNHSIDNWSAYTSTALAVRTKLIDQWNTTQQHFADEGVKMVNYMSLEWLIGRSLQNNLFNLGMTDNCRKALHNLGMDLENLYDAEHASSLGNGGLGRLAACFIDSLATMNLPATGYGLLYRFGMFTQTIVDGYQVEHPEFWLTKGSPWIIDRFDICYPVKFGGHVRREMVDGEWRFAWEGGQNVTAVAADLLISGFGTQNVLNLRLWNARPEVEFDFQEFGMGNFYHNVQLQQEAHNITAVLYPNDATYEGRLLRLKAEYFFVSATIQDVLNKFKQTNKPYSELHKFHTVQLNDTHPALAIPELIRILVDECDVTWSDAYDICTRVFNYTNHTVLPEALEKWSVSMLEQLLPRHLEIIYEINHRFLAVLRKRGAPIEDIRAMSIIEEGDSKKVRMANMAVIVSKYVNGVAAIHSQIVKDVIFHAFYKYNPEKFQNKTNGVTPRRWIGQANPDLTSMITRCLKTDKWLNDLDMLEQLEQFQDKPKILERLATIKKSNKQRFADLVERLTGVTVPAHFLFDLQAKRIHEYKRQFLNILGTCAHYLALKNGEIPEDKIVPRFVCIAGKAAPAYHNAKMIIKLIHGVADVVNNDPEMHDKLRIAFVPNYNVEIAELLIPASDISEQVSLAGTEASGTGNMKFVGNGGLIVGTQDGANIEIAERYPGSCFFFGLTKDEVADVRAAQGRGELKTDVRLQRVFDAFEKGMFGNPSAYREILGSIHGSSDFYLVKADFDAYMKCWEEIDSVYQDTDEWNKRCLSGIANIGFFSSDRTIGQYAKEIWGIEGTAAPTPMVWPSQDCAPIAEGF